MLAAAALLAGAVLSASPAQAATRGPAGASAPAASGQVASAAFPYRFRTARVTRFEQVKGQAAWANSALSRVQNAVWVFSGNGTFAFTTTNVRSDLYPLRGRFQRQGDSWVFAANGSSRIGGSSSFTEVVGNIDFSGNRPVMRFHWASGAGYGSVVNNQRFGAGASSAYSSTLILATG
ncbi:MULTISPECIES: hypothetical protein [unclassified Streptosporangium]|uniref:hypothetical protein n=1 Tax=unclassified Streptosporangium TaxID=2632669 RepID=UPI002E29F8F4|nr:MULTISPECIES: hypothetical protein [unclassified Streptosporangium]